MVAPAASRSLAPRASAGGRTRGPPRRSLPPTHPQGCGGIYPTVGEGGTGRGGRRGGTGPGARAHTAPTSRRRRSRTRRPPQRLRRSHNRGSDVRSAVRSSAHSPSCRAELKPRTRCANVSAKQFIFLVAWLSHPGTTIFDAYASTISISSHLSSLDGDLTK